MWPKCGRVGGYATLGPVTSPKLFMRKYFMWQTFPNFGEKRTQQIQHNNISSTVHGKCPRTKMFLTLLDQLY